MPRPVLLLTLAVLIGAAAPARAQDMEADARFLFADTIADLRETTDRARWKAIVGSTDLMNYFAWAAVPEARAEILRALENQRIGKQVGAPVLPSGSTSLVAKGDTPSVIGFALERGLVSGTRAGNTVTIRGNLMGLMEGLVEGFGMPPSSRPEAGVLRRLSFSASFDPGTSDDLRTDGPDDSGRLVAWTGRVDLLNRRHAQDYVGEAWADLLANAGRHLAAATAEAIIALQRTDAYREWLAATDAAIDLATPDTIEAVFLDRLAAFRALEWDAGERALIERAAAAYRGYLASRRTVLDRIATAPVLSVEYTHRRPQGLSRTSNVRFIADGPFFSGSVTGNVSVTFFDATQPAGTGRLRDVQAAVQYDWMLRAVSPTAAPVLVSLALQGQWLREDVVLDQVLFPDTSGTMVAGQLKLTVPVGDTPVRVPISLTYANRTELITERLVRGQIGMTFDVDALLAGVGSRR